MLLIAAFALLSMLLSSVGVYGVFAYSVSQRRQEMGIRLALAASRQRLLRLVVGQATGLVLVGSTLGVGTALLAGRYLSGALVGVTTHDPVSLLGAWALMTAIAVLASFIPAAATADTDVTSVLRSE